MTPIIRTHIVRTTRLALAAAVVALLAACAHPISLEPTQQPQPGSATTQVPKKVAYVITDADRALEVTTPGGGGDKVNYFPYRDIEKSLRAALRSVYQDVTSMPSATDQAALSSAGVAYVFAPRITTTSDSSSPFTWPPTRFGVEINCAVTDANGIQVAQFRVNGDGTAEFSEFKSDYSLAARRAVADVADKLAREVQRDARLH